ncbi:hypothetical protein G9U51_12385 [Calidifontibacter sp. DB0510]|uniref:SGNH domain-containing protein n=1 Tax=Metallococcus carri TaxID=1656884 RepID=A0A967B6Q8_9MICO|nr:SGNH hydrolase domain-containing protein [Metallococcus carri]NHN56577.1 hypothetical protein [Metallococcus carri]NOP38876.1 hypothetical protein [Calidifontibacter sp. DB2511S]
MYDLAVIGALQKTRRVQVATWSSCPLIDIVIESGRRDPAGCRRYVTGSTSWLTSHRDGAPVILGMSAAELSNPRTALIDPATGERATSAAEKAKVWTAGLRRTVLALSAAGHPVYVVQIAPHFPVTPYEDWWNPADCPNWKLRTSLSTCAPSISRAQADRDQRLLLDAQANALQGTPARLIVVRDALCPNARCAVNQDTEWIYRDGVHITQAESWRLRTLFARALTQPTS